MASIQGFKLTNISDEEYVGDTGFIFGSLYCGNHLGEFVRKRNVPQYMQYIQYLPDYMFLSTSITSFSWTNEFEFKDICKWYREHIKQIEYFQENRICILLDYLFNLYQIEDVWKKNGETPIQCVWNHKAYRIFGLNHSETFSPFDEKIQQTAIIFSRDFGLPNISWFETEDDFNLSGKIADKSKPDQYNIVI